MQADRANRLREDLAIRESEASAKMAESFDKRDEQREKSFEKFQLERRKRQSEDR